MREQKLAMFDWNGTLLDDVKIAHKGVSKIFQHFGLIPPPFDEYRNEITVDIISFYHQRGIPPTTSYEDLNKIFKPVIEGHWGRVELSRYANPLLRHCEMFEIPRVLITMENDVIIGRRIKQFKLTDKFDQIIARAHDKAAVMKSMLDKFGVKDPQEAFYLGDTIGDIEASKEAGVVSIAYTNGYNSRKKLEAAKPDYLVDGLWDVILLLSENKPSIEIGW